MARIRTVKPEFFTSEDVVSLSPFARLLFIATWCEADREGRMFWKPKTFKMRYFPADSVDIDALCGELIERGLVVLYGDGLAEIPTFDRHQHINPRESASVIPSRDASPRVKHASARVSDAQVGRKGKEGKEHASSFDAFWQAYPRKDSKGQALKTWEKLKPNEQLLAAILAGIGRAVTSEKWRKNGGEFIPHASTWLNAEGWLDQGVALGNPAGHEVFV